ncbi:hypothetical protein PCANC_03906 [Puccinia coronata f. sp. avenae]|uniref:Uncharacterized protein n=1 Tax=Puccinia coronata f. sp. avenae TaxID=200324 RepID=A0A2N5W1D3_9BASI|nr:hypothetical protein PCANC_03906 [Puccinia coronata f. sp. avenae]
MSPGVLSHSSLAICNSHGDPGSHLCQGNFAHRTLTATRSHQPTDIKGPMLVSTPWDKDNKSNSICVFITGSTAGINRSNTAARAVLEQPCSTGVRTDTVRPKREPTGQTDLSDQSRLVLCNRSQELIGQACPTRRQVLRSDMQVYAFVRLAQTQRVGPPICQAGTNLAGRSTYSRSWYQPSGQVYLLAELVPAQRAGLPARRAGTSPAGRSTCSPSWYQPSGQVYLLAELVPAQRAGLPARRAGTSPAGRSTCSPSWYQPSGQVYLLAELVPAQRAGLPARRAGTSPAGRSTCSPSWYQPSGQVYLLAELVPAQRAGLPARRAGTSPAGRSTCSPSWYQPSGQV